MFQKGIDFIKNNPQMMIVLVVAIIIGIVIMSTSNFKNTLITPMNQFETGSQPMVFPKISQPVTENIQLADPVVPEEIGLGMVYPQGNGVGMSKSDSNSFEPGRPGPLLTDYTIPESYGESSLSDPMGTNGANQGSRIIKIKDAGSQLMYKPTDESLGTKYAAAYTQGEVQDGPTLINGAQAVNYENGYTPEQNLKLQTSPGQQSTLPNCESTYPNVVKYGDMCITEGDIPYGQVVDNKVNPRLVSRWESFTGNYSRENALAPIDGLLYPNLNVLVK
jgi:hypothetical protein